MKGGKESVPAVDVRPEITILVVEDDFWTRYTVAEYLRAAGYRILEAKDADDAISLVSSGKQIDVVFSDIQMPGSMDGIVLTDWIGRRYPHLPVVLTSGLRPTTLPAACRAFFVKPCSLTDVEREIRGFFGSDNAIR